MSELEYAEEERKEIGEDRYEAFCKTRKDIWNVREARGDKSMTLEDISDLHFNDDWSHVVFAVTSRSECSWISTNVHRLPSIDPVTSKAQKHKLLCENNGPKGSVQFKRLDQMEPFDCMDYDSVYLHHGNGRFYLYDRNMVKQARQTMRNAMKRPCSCPPVACQVLIDGL